MSSLELAIIITGCIVSVAGVASATILKLRVKSSCCSVTPTEILEHGDPSIPSIKDTRESSNTSIKDDTQKRFEDDLSKLEKIIEDSKQLSNYTESFSD